jgi:hypothetical protein
VIEAQVVLSSLEALLDRPAQTGRAGELGEAGARRSKGEVVGSLVRRLAAAADQHPVLEALVASQPDPGPVVQAQPLRALARGVPRPSIGRKPVLPTYALKFWNR